jgi:hypothetical protein
MKTFHFTRTALPALAASILLGLIPCTYSSAQVKPAQRSSPEARIESVGKLLEKSSAARQVEASHNPQATALRKQAQDIYQQALDAHRAGDRDKTTALLDKAAKTMFQAVQLAAKDSVVREKQRTDFENRLQSLQALLDAYQRISAEKKLGAKAENISREIKAKMGTAQGLYREGDLVKARSVLDQAYVTAKQAIENLRGGETLVRSLHFNSKEEEYRYELDRNDTHRMLLKVLVEQKGQSAGASSMRQKFVDESARLRAQAESQAARADYQAAVHTLEQSTRALVQAIRAAGIYIPG